jgi:transposase
MIKAAHMKNRYLKNAHLSERKVKEILQLFCADLNATQIAHITGISRITINSYLKLIRYQIAQFCEERNPYKPSVPFFVIPTVHSVINASSPDAPLMFGVFRHEGEILSEKLLMTDRVWMYKWLKKKIEPTPHMIEMYRLNLYEAIMDLSSARLFHLENKQTTVNGRPYLTEIDMFWGHLKARILKFRGINTNTLYLHIKETEFRFNNRNADLYGLLHKIINERPLHYFKQLEY